MNKKIKNATPKYYNGIHFRSTTEVRMYKRLRELGYNPLYEVDTFTLAESFRPEEPWFLDGDAQVTKKGVSKKIDSMTYTPDFRLNINGNTVLYIEVKGHPNDSYPLKRKLFLGQIEQHNAHSPKKILFAEIHTITGLNKLMKLFE